MYVHVIGLIITILLAQNVVVHTKKADGTQMLMMKKSFFLLSTIPFTLISGLRYFVGTDWKMYRNVFLQIKKGRQFSSLYFEKGYLALNKLVGFFSGNYVVFFTVIAFLITAFWFVAIYYFSDNPTMSIILWVLTQFYFFSFNGIRQALAISLFYFGLVYLHKKNYVAYIVVMIIAISMHRSAIVMAPVMLMANLRMRMSRYVEVLVAACILGRFSVQIVNSYSFFEKYRMYLNIKNDFSVSDFVVVFVAWLFAISIKKYASYNNNEKFNMFYNILFLALVFCILTAFVPYVYRFLLYFKYVTILLIPEICKEYRYNKTSITVKVTMYAVYLIQIFYYAFVMHYNEYTHYAWVIGK